MWSVSFLFFLCCRHLTLEYVGKDMQKCVNFVLTLMSLNKVHDIFCLQRLSVSSDYCLRTSEFELCMVGKGGDVALTLSVSVQRDREKYGEEITGLEIWGSENRMRSET